MKKITKRILCGALSLTMCSTLALEGVLRLNADGSSQTIVSADAAFTDVTGKYDTSKIREDYFNDSVMETTETTATYETRTVMITLSASPIVKRAGNASVSDYLDTWDGNRAAAELRRGQQDFLQALSRKGISYKLEHTYSNVINAVAVELDTKYVADIKEMSGVESVVITTAYAEPQTESSSGSNGVVYNETEVRATGIYDSTSYASYGEGMVVAVLDTGLDYTHDAFQGFQSSDVDFAWDKATIANMLASKSLVAEERSGSLEAADVYRNDKVPFAYDYADDDADVYPSYSNHGTHVAGIIGGYADYYTDKDGHRVDEEFIGVVPDAQLMICKVFTDDLDDPDLGGAVSEDIVAALEDCVTLGVDVINMSLGSSCGFTTTDDGDSEGEMLNAVYENIKAAGISLICAASNDYSAGYGGVYGTNLASNPDAGTVGSPSTYAAALSVASINGQQASYAIANAGTDNESYVFFEEARDINSNAMDFVEGLMGNSAASEMTFEYVVIPGVGHAADYTANVKTELKQKDANGRGRLALIKRGDTTFEEKVKIAMEMGAAGVIIYNNVAGTIRMNLGNVKNPVPSISISMNSGAAMVQGATGRVGKITISRSYAAGPFMSEFSSWGPTPDLKLKPEITAHGGEITSAVPGGYGEQSGTSMATPNMAGFMAIVRGYIEQNLSDLVTVDGKIDNTKLNQLAMQLTMSTAGTVYDQDGLPYSPRKQGAGVAKLENIVDGTTGTRAYLSTDSAENDNRPKIELGADTDKTGVYEFSFNLHNFGTTNLSFTTDLEFMTETLSSDKLTVSEQAHMLSSSKVEWSATNGALSGNTVTVKPGEKVVLSVKITLSDKDRTYIEDSFENGMYVEGFAKLKSTSSTQCDLTLPFLGFYGDWEDAPMLDYSAYEIAENEKDSSILEEDKIKASVWATQPYNIYYNEKYVLPMGGYLYLLPDDADPMYVNEEYNAVSRYNEYYGEGDVNNYMTTTGIKAVYAGLLRNARVVRYNLIDEATGEVLMENQIIPRVAKAYAGGGSAVPANVKLELFPEAEGLLANGRYTMQFEFFREEPEDGEVASEENTFEFSFTVDYEAPVLQAARVRFEDYKDGKKEKQRIYLDVDVFDNHYAQTLMLCYPRSENDAVTGTNSTVLQLATEYPTPIRNAVKNGVTTVTLDITDIYEKYGDQLYIQLDDYALNTCLYQVNIVSANGANLPDGFDLASGEKSLSLDIYETHKVSLVYGEEYATANLSNFQWKSSNPKVADVKNGEIVGLGKGTATISVTNRKGATKTITVTVSDVKSDSLARIPAISMGAIKTSSDSLQKASGSVSVNPGQTIALEIITDPWYHPMTDLKIVWSSSKPEVASVDEETGVVTTWKAGTANISAVVWRKNASGEWEETLYSTISYMTVEEEFTVSSYTLNDYNGWGYTVNTDEKEVPEGEEWLTAEDGILRIPSNLNVMYIGEEAFKDNTNIKVLIIPASVTEIRARAFLDCTALEEVYFVSTDHKEIADSDLTMINESAFQGCINLKKIDFTNVKTTTIAADAFANCENLTTVEGMTKIGTMHHRAFMNTGLTSVDISGLHMSGKQVFKDCTSLTSVTTGKFTAIGYEMFAGCTSLRQKITLNNSKIGEGAFADCVNLSGVVLAQGVATGVEYDIGARAFENCGAGVGSFAVEIPAAVTLRSIGENAFLNAKMSSFAFENVKGLEALGGNAFGGTGVTTVYLYDDMNISSVRVSGIPFANLTVEVAAEQSRYAYLDTGIIYDTNVNTIVYVDPTLTGEYTLPTSITAIGAYAFANASFTKVYLHEGLVRLGEGAFAEAKLTEISFADGIALAELPANVFKGSSLTSVTVPESVTAIGAYAFSGSHLNEYQGGENVLSYGDGAFSKCLALQQISLAEGQEATMGDGVFQGCTSLTTVTLPSVSAMGEQTFVGAEKLDAVTFGDGSTVTGVATFAGTPIKTVTLGSGQTTIENAAFLQCEQLTSIDLKNCTTVEAFAFAGCSALTTVTNLDKATTIGVAAFLGTSLTGTLRLEKAQTIADNAFEGVATFTALEMPVVTEIGSFAFYDSGLTSVTLPKTLKNLGAGAFASSDKLKTVAVETGSEYFFVENNVLYRYANEGKSVYELTFYPAALQGEGEKGSRTYSVKEGTARIFSYAFYELNDDMLSEVVLPYSVNAIGVAAFMDSGITEYTFESIKAPTLEVEYDGYVRSMLNNNPLSTTAVYKGYYYSNFATYYYYYSPLGGEESPLTINYPRNGTGYSNPIYATYFGVRTASAADLMNDDTRACVNFIDGADLELVKSWKTAEVNEANKALVEAFTAEMKRARGYYNNAMADEGQKVFITEERQSKLLAIEEELRAVKVRFNIPFIVDELRVAADSAHRTEYTAGETFDMSGLKLEIVYDDYSVEDAPASGYSLLTTNALSKDDKYVEVAYDGNIVYVPVTVTDAGTESADDGADDKDDSTDGGLLWIILGGVGGAAVLGVVIFLLVRKKRNVLPKEPTETPVAEEKAAAELPQKKQKKKKVKRDPKAEEAEKARRLAEFEREYGEIHTSVTAVVYPTDDEKDAENSEKMLGEIESSLTANVPEGAKIKHNVDIKRK